MTDKFTLKPLLTIFEDKYVWICLEYYKYQVRTASVMINRSEQSFGSPLEKYGMMM